MAHLLKSLVLDFDAYAGHKIINKYLAEFFGGQAEHRPPSLYDPEVLGTYPEENQGLVFITIRHVPILMEDLLNIGLFGICFAYETALRFVRSV